MRVLLITFEISGLGGNKAGFLTALKSTENWARLTEGTYLVLTSETPERLRDRLVPFRGLTGKVWVGVAPAPSAWIGLPDDVSQWIQRNQR